MQFLVILELQTTTVKLLEYSHFNKDISVKVLGGKSFIDDIFEAVDVDPNDGFTLLDGTSLKRIGLKCSYKYGNYSEFIA